MKVKELIDRLKELPQTLDVYFSAHDNMEHELSGSVEYLYLFDKAIHKLPVGQLPPEKEWYDQQPKRAVVLRG